MSKLKPTTQLALGGATLILITLTLIYMIVSTMIENTVYRNAISIAQRDTAIHAEAINTWFQRHVQLVENLARVWKITGVEAGEFGFGPDPISADLLGHFDTVEGIVIGFEDDSHINAIGWVPDESFYATQRPWHIAARQARGDVVITLPYFRRFDNNLVSSIAQWNPDIMGMEAVVAIDIFLDYVFDMVAVFQYETEGYYALVSSDGYIIIHPNVDYMISYNENYATHLLSLPNGEFLYSNIRNRAVEEFYDFVMSNSYLISVPLSAIDLTLLAVIPTATTESEVNRFTLSIMGAFSALSAGVLISTAISVLKVSKRSERLEIKLQEEKSNARIKIAEESNRAKSKFLATMSHEIRTPLNAVLGISEIRLHAGGLPKEVEESFVTIRSSSVLLLGIVNDILDLSKIESGKMEIFNTKYKLSHLIGGSINLNFTSFSGKNLDFKIEIDENLPTFLIGDMLRIKQIMNNLLSNAFKYTNNGSVKLSISHTPVDDNNTNILISVHDTGMGMTEEQLKTLRDEYTRFHEHVDLTITGTGLGMSIVYHLSELMGGSVSIASKKNVGTTVVISIPQKISSTEKIGATAAKAFESVYATPHDRVSNFVPEPMPYGRVLVVDDVDANLYVAKGLLEFYDIKTETCTSGFQAIDIIRRGEVYDIIFMDSMMPNMDGTTAMKKIRDMGYKGTIIVLTADAIVGRAKEFVAQGFDSFLSKPIRTERLNALLVKYIRNKQTPETIEKAQREARSSRARDIHNYQKDSELLEKLYREFVKTANVGDIRKSVNDGELKTAHILAHTLKTSAAMLGETLLMEAALDVECALAEGKEVTVEQLDRLEKEEMVVLSKINIPEPEVAVEVLSDAEVLELLDTVEVLVKTSNSEVLGYTGRLRGVEGSEDLIEQIEELEFEAAFNMVQKLKDGLSR